MTPNVSGNHFHPEAVCLVRGLSKRVFCIPPFLGGTFQLAPEAVTDSFLTAVGAGPHYHIGRQAKPANETFERLRSPSDERLPSEAKSA